MTIDWDKVRANLGLDGEPPDDGLIAELPIELKSGKGEKLHGPWTDLTSSNWTFNVWDEGDRKVFGLAFAGGRTYMTYGTHYIDMDDFPHAGLERFYFDVGRGLYCERAELERLLAESGLKESR